MSYEAIVAIIFPDKKNDKICIEVREPLNYDLSWELNKELNKISSAAGEVLSTIKIPRCFPLNRFSKSIKLGLENVGGFSKGLGGPNLYVAEFSGWRKNWKGKQAHRIIPEPYGFDDSRIAMHVTIAIMRKLWENDISPVEIIAWPKDKDNPITFHLGEDYTIGDTLEDDIEKIFTLLEIEEGLPEIVTAEC
ncbi:hypothetical protein ACFL24_01820 [Patescibacteria group bacterium]